MKTIFKMLLSLGVIAFVIFGVKSIADSSKSEDYWFHSVKTEIIDGCYIEDLDTDFQSIYYYPDGNEEAEPKYIVNEWEDIIKYASDGKATIAFHCIYNKYEDEEKDRFVVFNVAEEKETSFDTQKDFIDYCTKENLTLSDWQSGMGKRYEKTELGNGWSLYNFDYPFNDKILIGSEVVYEGYVVDLEKKDNGCAEFIFAVPYDEKKEIPESNSSLDVGDSVVGEYKFALGGKDEVVYYEKLSLDTATGKVTVIGE